MAQPPKPAIPPDPNAGRNIHGQPNQPPNSDPEGHPQGAQGVTGPHPATREQVNIHGQAPKAHMAPTEEPPSGLGDNTRAEMDAGKANLAQYSKRNDAEHEAGRHAVEQRSQRESQK